MSNTSDFSKQIVALFEKIEMMTNYLKELEQQNSILVKKVENIENYIFNNKSELNHKTTKPKKMKNENNDNENDEDKDNKKKPFEIDKDDSKLDWDEILKNKPKEREKKKEKNISYIHHPKVMQNHSYLQKKC